MTISAIDNAFKLGDVEDRGVIDVAQLQYIASQVTITLCQPQVLNYYNLQLFPTCKI